MEKFKRLLIAGVAVSALAACSADDEQQSETTEDGKTILKVAYKDDGPSNDQAVKYYETLSEKLAEDKDLDVQFELVEVAQGDYAEKLSLLLNSGEIPDLIYFQGGDQQIANQDLLEDLRPYIEESENLKDILQPHNELRLNNYPYLLWVKPIDYKVPVVRGDIMNSLPSSEALLADPTIDNYKAFFEDLVQEGNAEYAVTVAGDISELDYIFENAFGINQSWLETDDGYVFSKVSEKEKEKLAFYKELYEEGLLDNQYLTKQWDTKEDAFYDGKAGLIVGTNGKVIDFYNSRVKEVNGEEAELVVLPPAKGEYQGFGASDITKESRGLAISATSPNKDLVFEVLDYLASPEGQELDRLGFEGEHHEVANDQIELTDAYYSDWYSRYWEPVNAEFSMPISEETPMLSEPANESMQLANEYFAEDNAFILPQEFVSQWDAMENLYREYSADIITGKLPIEAFDDFVDEWYAAGGTELTELANEKIE
ncbi:extracellular solute-binding protein [Jeotgalibacillus terrae]|uniref:Extracellular solute-binding protein n=1 Tax=Jeotgalibacillus terrae TaxID=587735 RepID=A0ABW5ZDL5_9BACL|nr:extracellular solute-binding protein [Jeotgalibacillus terrae]MBM7577855.1 putative aldouronate transport system substrate-binding protein [Jeotgalibacillus terrae]